MQLLLPEKQHAERGDAMNNGELTWHPASKIFPMLSDDKLMELADDIEKNGQREPVLLLDGMVLDGRNRMCACKIKGIPPLTKVVTGIGDPAEYVFSLNYHRRHMTPSQASMCAARRSEFYEQQAKERMLLGKKSDPQANLPEGQQSRDAAGKAFGVSGRSVEYAKKVIDKGIPELAKAVDEGRMAVSTAAILASEPEEIQKSEIEKPTRNRTYKSTPKEDATIREARHPGEHNESEVFALTKADVAISQLKGIPAKNTFREAALLRVHKWVSSQLKADV
jgi:hypothetical protein